MTEQNTKAQNLRELQKMRAMAQEERDNISQHREQSLFETRVQSFFLGLIAASAVFSTICFISKTLGIV